MNVTVTQIHMFWRQPKSLTEIADVLCGTGNTLADKCHQQDEGNHGGESETHPLPRLWRKSVDEDAEEGQTHHWYHQVKQVEPRLSFTQKVKPNLKPQ